MTPLLRQFLIEGRDLIQEASDGLLALEHASGDRDRVTSVFRAFHTLKGGSALFDVRPFTEVLHAAEEILAGVRNGRRALDRPTIDLLLSVLDRSGQWLDALEVEGELPPDSGPVGASLVRALRGESPVAEDAAAAVGAEAGSEEEGAEEGAAPAWARGLPAAERAAVLDRGRETGWTGPLVAIAYDPDPQCFFNGDDPVNLFRRLPGIAALRVMPRDPWPPVKDLDPFSCNIVVRCLAFADPEDVRQLFRFVSDQVRISTVSPEALQVGGDEGLAREAFSRSRDRVRAELVLAILREQQRVLAGSRSGPEFEGRLGSAARVIANALWHEGREGDAQHAADAYAEAMRSESPVPLLDFLSRVLDRREPAAVQPVAPGRTATGAGKRPGQDGGGRVLRVDVARVERLVALAGEVMVAKTGLEWVARRAEHEVSGSGLARDIHDLQIRFDRLARDLHEAAIQIRMLPVGQVFQRFPRLVRDITQQLDKKVEFILEGQETEADKAVVDMLFEPVLHLLRNALDHGIESPAERRDAGKPERGRLVLRTSGESRQITIEVTDDGRGIDPAALRRRAVAQGLLNEKEAAGLEDSEALKLIFAPGLTTARTVSEISGRGVGMDAVRSAVERAGGAVVVTSQLGQGSSVLLTLPISLAGLRIMIVTAGRHRFGVPLESVIETVLLPRRDVRLIKDQQAFVLRDQVVPLRRLDGLLGLGMERPGDAGGGPSGDARVLVVDSDGSLVGIEVDAVGDRLDSVLRPLDGLLADIPGYLGTTLLADGAVLLILDLKGLMR